MHFLFYRKSPQRNDQQQLHPTSLIPTTNGWHLSFTPDLQYLKVLKKKSVISQPFQHLKKSLAREKKLTAGLEEIMPKKETTKFQGSRCIYVYIVLYISICLYVCCRVYISIYRYAHLGFWGGRGSVAPTLLTHLRLQVFDSLVPTK